MPPVHGFSGSAFLGPAHVVVSFLLEPSQRELSLITSPFTGHDFRHGLHTVSDVGLQTTCMYSPQEHVEHARHSEALEWPVPSHLPVRKESTPHSVVHATHSTISWSVLPSHDPCMCLPRPQDLVQAPHTVSSSTVHAFLINLPRAHVPQTLHSLCSSLYFPAGHSWRHTPPSCTWAHPPVHACALGPSQPFLHSSSHCSHFPSSFANSSSAQAFAQCPFETNGASSGQSEMHSISAPSIPFDTASLGPQRSTQSPPERKCASVGHSSTHAFLCDA